MFLVGDVGDHQELILVYIGTLDQESNGVHCSCLL
jgi:hypothetical protein